jgi:RNA polymerase sigma-70 factor (ECF subfamily)
MVKKIVINKSINHLKKNKKYQTEELFETRNSPIYIEEEIDTLFALNTNETNSQIAKVLKTLQLLTSGYKTILTLYNIIGFDLQEIESILQINNQNCRTMLTRAKESLKLKMTEK